MGAWGTGLYANDTAEDVLDECRVVYSIYPVEEGTEILCKVLLEEMSVIDDEDEICHFWYALADFQWNKGILLESVKEKALEMLERNVGMDLWLEEGNQKDIENRRQVQKRLKEKLQSPPPPKKKINGPKLTADYKIGDIICYYLTDIGIAEWSLYSGLSVEELSYKILLLCVDIEDGGTFSTVLKDMCYKKSIFAIYDWKSNDMPEISEIPKMNFLPVKSTSAKKDDIFYCITDAVYKNKYQKVIKVAKNMSEVERFKKNYPCDCGSFPQMKDLLVAYDNYHKRLVKHPMFTK